MGGFGFSLALAPRRPIPAAGAGGAVPATMLAGAVAAGAGASLAALTVTVEQAETGVLIARMTTPPGATRRGQIDTLIAGLKADGVWPKLDWLVLTAAHDAQAARLNWCAAKAMSAVNAPAFTVDRGYQGDGATAYLSFGEALGAGQLRQDSATLGVWVNAQGAGGACNPMSQGTISYIGANAGGPQTQRLNTDGNTASIDIGTRTGHFALVRAAAAGFSTYWAARGDAAQAQRAAGAAVSVPPVGDVDLLRYNGFGIGGGYCPDRIAAAYAGAALDAAGMSALHARLKTYLTALGAA